MSRGEPQVDIGHYTVAVFAHRIQKSPVFAGEAPAELKYHERNGPINFLAGIIKRAHSTTPRFRHQTRANRPCPLIRSKSAPRLIEKQAIVLVLLLSLGLWGMIWGLVLAIRYALVLIF
jgi:hypothetical protein